MRQNLLSILIGLFFPILIVTQSLSLETKDIITLKQAGVSDGTIQLLMKEKSQETGALTVPEILELKRAGVSEQTLQAVIREGSFLKHAEPIVYGRVIRPIRCTTIQDIITLKEAGLSDDVIKAIIVFGSRDLNDPERERAWQMLTNMGIFVDMREKQ